MKTTVMNIGGVPTILDVVHLGEVPLDEAWLALEISGTKSSAARYFLECKCHPLIVRLVGKRTPVEDTMPLVFTALESGSFAYYMFDFTNTPDFVDGIREFARDCEAILFAVAMECSMTREGRREEGVAVIVEHAMFGSKLFFASVTLADDVRNLNEFVEIHGDYASGNYANVLPRPSTEA